MVQTSLLEKECEDIWTFIGIFISGFLEVNMLKTIHTLLLENYCGYIHLLFLLSSLGALTTSLILELAGHFGYISFYNYIINFL